MAVKKGKKDKTKNSKAKQLQNMVYAGGKMKAFLDMYDTLCQKHNTSIFIPLRKQIKQSMDESKLLLRFLVDPADRTPTYYWEDEMLPDIFAPESSISRKKKKDLTQNLVKILPLLESIKMVRYTFIQELLVWGAMIEYEEMAALAYLLTRKIYTLVKLELIDCFLDAKSLQILAPTIKKCYTLRELVLDANEFGDEGCDVLCQELKKSIYLYTLSLNGCSITKLSGYKLGDLVVNSTVRELYLDNNFLQSEGVIAMVGTIVQAIKPANELMPILDKNIKFKRLEMTFEQKSELLSEQGPGIVITDTGNIETPIETPVESAIEIQVENPSETPVKKKKKKSKISKVLPLVLGPEICKLSLADNRIGRYGLWQTFTPVLCMQQVKLLITTCKDLEEIDIFGNDISNIAARQILEGLTERKNKRYPQIGVRMCHILNQDMYDAISKLAPGSKKKRKGSKKN